MNGLKPWLRNRIQLYDFTSLLFRKCANIIINISDNFALQNPESILEGPIIYSTGSAIKFMITYAIFYSSVIFDCGYLQG